MAIAYPIKFNPILKDKIWGGENLIHELQKKSMSNCLGESWEISSVPENISVVSNGFHRGASLEELIKLYDSDLLGMSVYKKFGNKFPLLIKFIDAQLPLSIQVHPNDALADLKHHSFGKTEMWYVMKADKNAELIVGFHEDVDQETYVEALKKDDLIPILNVEKAKLGDVFFIPTGRIHAIGAGVMLVEIQQSSDVTYRVYDWNRPDAEGNYRELHTADALEALDFSVPKSYKTAYIKSTNKTTNLVTCPYFKTNIIPIEGIVCKDYEAIDSFVIYVCTSGRVQLFFKGGKCDLQKGETVLLPAILKEVEILSLESSEILEIYIEA